jgi:hypothetical protein
MIGVGKPFKINKMKRRNFRPAFNVKSEILKRKFDRYQTPFKKIKKEICDDLLD